MQDVDVDLVFLLSSHSPVAGRDGTSASSIHGVSILGEPFSDSLETGDELRINLAVRVRADVQQQVGVVPCGADQAAFDFGYAFVGAVSDIEAPGAVQSVGAFERDIAAYVFCVESSRVLAGQIALESLHVFTRARRLMMIR